MTDEEMHGVLLVVGLPPKTRGYSDRIKSARWGHYTKVRYNYEDIDWQREVVSVITRGPADIRNDLHDYRRFVEFVKQEVANHGN